MTDKIIDSIRAHQSLSSWHEDNGRYIPVLARFLREAMWEDQLAATAESSKKQSLSPQERAAIEELMEADKC